MELMILNSEFQAIDIVDTYESLIWTERYFSAGDFELYTSVEEDILKKLVVDTYLWTKDSSKCMIVEDRGIDTDVETGARLKITGRSLESILDRRVIWNATTLTGNLQLGVKKLLDENVIAPSITSRKIDNFIFKTSTDPAITELTIEEYFLGENLLDAIELICMVYNIGFRVLLTDDNKFEFELYSGADRSYAQETNPYVIFSPKFENLINSNYLESKKMRKTVGLVVGESTSVTVDKTSETGLSRRELFVDAGYLNDSAQLQSKGEEELAQNVDIQSFEGEIETQELFRYDEDFFIGDIVQIMNEYGIGSRVRISEIVRSKSVSETSVIPTLMTVY